MILYDIFSVGGITIFMALLIVPVLRTVKQH